MNDKDAEFLRRLLATFRVEAQEHLQGISAALLELEKCGSAQRQAELVENTFREAHSLKGAARAVNLGEIEELCQSLENVFSRLKKGEFEPSAGLVDLLLQTLDFLGQLLPNAEVARTQQEKIRQRELVRQLNQASQQEFSDEGYEADVKEPPAPSPPPEPPAPPPAEDETVRIATTKVAAVLLQAEELVAAKLDARERYGDLRGTSAAFGAWKREWAQVVPLLRELRPVADCNRPDLPGEGSQALPRILAFLQWNSAFMGSLEERYVAVAKSTKRDGRRLGSMVNNLLDQTKQILLFPFSSLLEIFPKIVRDLARDRGKEVELKILGGETRIDRRILQEMKDPLVHLIRNCIDHGIEKPQVRREKDKPERGTIIISAATRDNKAEIVVADDGGGIAANGIRTALLKLGTLSREVVASLTDQEVIDCVFRSGVSTSPIITELSGRGLGLAIVREKVEKLGGAVSLDTDQTGTRFRIMLPLTLATFRGILVRVGERTFILPTRHVERVLRLKQEEVKTVEGRETIQLHGRPLSVARLADALELVTARGETKTGLLQAALLTADDTRIAFVVDEVLQEQEILLKNLGQQLSRVRNVSGATILGNGSVVPVLNVPDLLKSAVKGASSIKRGAVAEDGEETPAQRSVLVAEDSITTRTLLKNILEAAGYAVVTAVDGMDAFSKLKSGSFHIVVSDVDMPRLNGFDLTARIRDDKSLADLPVVLITALASREDKERGIDVGANAYIVKSSFDQSNLLEVMDKLV